MMAAIGAALALGLALGLAISRSVRRQLGTEPAEIERVAEALSRGDLSLSLDEGKATGAYASIKGMVAKLVGVVSSIQQASRNVSVGSDEISRTAQVLS